MMKIVEKFEAVALFIFGLSLIMSIFIDIPEAVIASGTAMILGGVPLAISEWLENRKN